jgi:perosamine synthetase
MGKRFIYAFPRGALGGCLSSKEKEFDPLLDDQNTIFVSTGRSAVYHAIRQLGLSENDKVLVPAYHCGVEIEAIIKAGVKICYYCVTGQMEVDKRDLERKVDKDTKALFVIHYWGFPQDIDWLSNFCNIHQVHLIEDCAHALYSKYNGLFLGTIGNMGIYSFPKTLALPNGGALRINGTGGSVQLNHPSGELSTLKYLGRLILEDMGNNPFKPLGWTASNILGVYKSIKKDATSNDLMGPLDSLNQYSRKISSISKQLLKQSDPKMIIQKRRENYLFLHGRLKGESNIDISFKSMNEGVCPLFFPIAVQKRNELQQYLLQNNIETFVFGRRLHPSLPRQEFIESLNLSDHLVGLPVHQELDLQDMERMVRALMSWFKTCQHI